MVSEETGEILSEETTTHRYLANTQEEFFLAYVSMLSVFKDISGPAIKVYAYLLLNNKSGVKIAITKAIKEDICTFIKSKSKSVTVIDNILPELLREGLLLKVAESRGTYMLNPRYAFKGSHFNRNKSLKAVLELGYEGKLETYD